MYTVIKSVNGGSTTVVAESQSLQTAVMEWHRESRALWGASDVITGYIAIMDSSLNEVSINGFTYKEFIFHEAPEPEPQEQSNNSNN